MGIRTLSAAALLALGSGCMTTDANKPAAPKKPDVMQPGVLPPPQDVLKPTGASASGGVVPAGGFAPVQPAAPAPSASPLAKVLSRPEKKVIATDFQIGWRNRIAYLPDPTRNGTMGAGLAGQMFLYGGPKMEFAQADGVLTVDLIDDTPRPPGQPAALPERWQIDKSTLRNLKTTDETFGKSYVLFLPWPAYRPDITKVKISARYDPEHGHTLYAAPTTVSIDSSAALGAPVWEQVSNGSSGGAQPQPQPQPQPFSGAPSVFPAPKPPGAFPLGGGEPIPLGGRGPSEPTGSMMPLTPTGGVAPIAPPPGLEPIAITIGRK